MSQQVRLGKAEPAMAGLLHAGDEQIDPQPAGLPEPPANVIQQGRNPVSGPIIFVKLLDQSAHPNL